MLKDGGSLSHRRTVQHPKSRDRIHEASDARLKPVTVSGLTSSRLEGGRLVEEFSSWDTFGMMQLLGAVPAPARA